MIFSILRTLFRHSAVLSIPAVPLRKVPIMIQMGPGARSDSSKAHVLSEYKTEKGCFIFLVTLPLCHEVNEEA